MRIRLFDSTLPLLLVALLAPPVAAQMTYAPARSQQALAPAGDASEGLVRQRREDWMLSLEAITHAPVDIGFQVGLQTPQRIRLSAGYGWVPGAYMNLLTGVAGNATNDPYAETLLDRAQYRGHSWRAKLGFKPFRNLGLYADVGYARLKASGGLDLADSGVPELAPLEGGYRASTRLDMWLIELGYQSQLADRLVLGLALGAMGTLDANTSITSVNGAPSSPLLKEVATEADTALRAYGIIPTLTLRLGFDLI